MRIDEPFDVHTFVDIRFGGFFSMGDAFGMVDNDVVTFGTYAL